MMRAVALVAMLATALSAFASSARAEQCGSQANGALCPNGQCCSKYGWCGTTSDYCTNGCQSQCSGGGVGSIISESLFNQMLLHRNDAGCPANGFYTYAAFLAAANAFPGFGTTGSSLDVQKRELAAFLAQTSDETTGGWATAPDGPYAPSSYCQPSSQWQCAAGKQYYGRGPIQMGSSPTSSMAGSSVPMPRR
nr:unnamed protein product [Digitaria exilis]